MKVFVYLNLNRPGYFSIKAKEGKMKNRVIGYARSVVMRDVIFHVSEATRQKVLRDKQRCVHAGALGEMISFTDEGALPLTPDFRHATYSPFKYSTFVDVDSGEAVHHAKDVILTDRTVYYR